MIRVEFWWPIATSRVRLHGKIKERGRCPVEDSSGVDAAAAAFTGSATLPVSNTTPFYRLIRGQNTLGHASYSLCSTEERSYAVPFLLFHSPSHPRSFFSFCGPYDLFNDRDGCRDSRKNIVSSRPELLPFIRFGGELDSVDYETDQPTVQAFHGESRVGKRVRKEFYHRSL